MSTQIRSIEEILRLNPDERHSEYKAVGIDKVTIDGQVFTNYSDFQFIWEKTYIKSPSTSGAGSIENLNSYATFLTPHLKINFSIMSIDDYRTIMKKHYEKNEFIVECYDVIYDTKIKVKMYFTTEEMAKLKTIATKRFNTDGSWEDWIDLVGVQEYTVEMVGTNSDLDLISVTYILNKPDGVSSTQPDRMGEPDVYRGEEIIIGKSATYQDETFNGRYIFNGWKTDTGLNYIDGDAYTINYSLVLYAQWISAEKRTLSFAYGAGKEQPITDKPVVKGQPIGELPTSSETPSVKYNGQDYNPYSNPKWYKTPVKTPTSVVITKDTPYWSNVNSIIYQIYDKNKYTLTFDTNGGSEIEPLTAEYGTTVALPIPTKTDNRFVGWFVDKELQQEFNKKIPPVDITLYAKWSK